MRTVCASPHVLKALPRDIILEKLMASKCGGATAFCSESSREGTNILVVKGTTHTGMKDVRTKAIVITLASFGLKKDEQFNGGLAVLWQ